MVCRTGNHVILQPDLTDTRVCIVCSVYIYIYYVCKMYDIKYNTSIYIYVYIYIYTPGTITSPKHHGSASMEKEKIVLSLW